MFSRLFLTLLFPVLFSGALHAKLVTRTIAYTHEGVSLEGYLAYDDEVTAKGPRPGILVVHEWWGHNQYVRSRAEQLAKLGYVAFALDMYGKGVTASEPKGASALAGQFYGKPLMATRAQAGLDQLLAQPQVDRSRVVSIGYCFGGAVSQSLALSGAPLVGMVSFHGSLLPVSAEAASRLKARYLVCHGAADGFISPEELTTFIKSINDQKVDCQFVSYAGAVHAFTNPEADAVAKAAGLSGVAYQEAADRRSWQHMQLFFRELFKE